MKILLVSPLPPPMGGIARWTENFKRFFEKEHTLEVVDTSLGASGARNVIFQIKRTYRILHSLSLALKDRFDIAHINSSCTPAGMIRDLLCAKKLKKKSIPFVFQCHCNIEDQLGNGRIAGRLFARTVKMADLVYVLNKGSYNYCVRYAPEKTKLCPNSVDDSCIAKEHVISQRINTALYVGHLYKSKGIDAIIKTAKKYPDICFRIVGKFTDEYNDTLNTSNLFFVGEKSREEVLKELDNADVFLFPSHTEGFSMALLEAMARGLSAVATDVGANREMLEEKGGIIVDCIFDDAIDLSAIEDQTVRAGMSAWSLNKVKTQYTHKIVFSDIESDYRRIEVK